MYKQRLMVTYCHSRLTTSPQADVARKVLLAPCKTLHSKLWHAAGLIKTSFSKFLVQRNLPSFNLVFWGLHGSAPEGLNSLLASCCHLCSLSPSTSGIGDPSKDSLGAPFGSYPFFLHPTFPSSLNPGCFFYPGLVEWGSPFEWPAISRNSVGQRFNLQPRSTRPSFKWNEGDRKFSRSTPLSERGERWIKRSSSGGFHKWRYPQKKDWLVVSTPLKNISQLRLLSPIYGRKKCPKPPTSGWFINGKCHL
jgi:hypothetical protein